MRCRKRRVGEIMRPGIAGHAGPFAVTLANFLVERVLGLLHVAWKRLWLRRAARQARAEAKEELSVFGSQSNYR